MIDAPLAGARAEAAARESALYVGTVMHQRLRPARHRLSYRVFSLLLDLDELPTLSKRLRLFSLNRFNLFSLHEKDYGDASDAGDAQRAADANDANDANDATRAAEAPGRGLRRHVERQLRAAGLPAGGAIRLLTMPRILGYAFNPLSVYFCHAAGGALQAILYEVNNTFGERHSYLIAVDGAVDAEASSSADATERIVQRCAKQLHVSPFLALDMNYLFRIEPPGAQRPALSVGVVAQDAEGAVLNARFDARRQTLGDAALARVFVTHPLLTLKVVGAIHWEAARLFIKGVRLQPRPASPLRSVTVIKPQDS